MAAILEDDKCFKRLKKWVTVSLRYGLKARSVADGDCAMQTLRTTVYCHRWCSTRYTSPYAVA